MESGPAIEKTSEEASSFAPDQRVQIPPVAVDSRDTLFTGTPPLRARDSIFLFAAIILIDFFCWRKIGGTGYGLAWALFLAGLWLTAPGERTLRAGALCLMGILLSLSNIHDVGLISISLPVLFAMMMTAQLTAPPDSSAHWLDSLLRGTISTAWGWARLVGHIRHLSGFSRGLSADRAAVLRKWLLPALAAFLVIFLFGGIFIFANPVLERLWDRLIEWLRSTQWLAELLDYLTPHPGRVFLWLIIAVFTAGVLRPVSWFQGLFVREEQELPVESDELQRNARVALAVLAAGAFAFLLYDLLDLLFLFVTRALPEGITDAQYAKRGTGWLTFALLLSTIFIGFATSERSLSPSLVRPMRYLARLWIALQLVMAVCVLGRINYYIVASGLTPLRVIGIAGTLTVAAGLVVMLVKVNGSRNLPWLIRREVAVFIVAVVLLELAPVDSVCALYNVRRASRGDSRPLMLLFSSRIPPASLGFYAPLIDNPDPLVRKGVSAYLAKRVKERRTISALEKISDWREFSGENALARRMLKSRRHLFREDQAALEALGRAVWSEEFSEGDYAPGFAEL